MGLDLSQPSLENSVCLAVDSFIFHLDWHLVWRSGTPCLCSSHLFFTTSKACCFTIQEPTEGLVGERFATKPKKEGKQFWICCSCCHEFRQDGFFSCYLGSRSLWVKLPVQVHHKSLCQPVNQMFMIKKGQVNCWVASFGQLRGTALFQLELLFMSYHRRFQCYDPCC